MMMTQIDISAIKNKAIRTSTRMSLTWASISPSCSDIFHHQIERTPRQNSLKIRDGQARTDDSALAFNTANSAAK